MRLRVFLLTTGIAALAAAAPARAATFTVSGTTDSLTGTCDGTTCTNLRAALAAAATATGPDTVNLPAVRSPYQASVGQLMVDSEVTITGAGAASVTVQGGGKNRVFDVTTTAKVTISHLTISGGAATSTDDGLGGGVRLDQGGNLTLDHVRVTGGTALRGGGIAMGPASTLTVTRSLIDHNTATFATGAVSGDAGALLSVGNAKLAGNVLHISDTTIAQNNASQGAGIELTNNAANQTTLNRMTIAFNSGGTNALGNGVSTNDAESIKIGSSIIAGNTGDGVPTNCDHKLTSTGGNIDTATSCGFAAPADKPGTDPQLSTVLGMAGGETPVLSIPATSPAVDFAPACTGADQRDLSRPQGKSCDSGAYEVDQVPQTTITDGPSGLVNSTTASFTFASSDPGSTFKCSLDGAAEADCSPPQTYNGLAQGAHTLGVRAIDPAGNPDPTPATQSWTVDSVPPDTTLTPITSPTKDNTPTFAFSSSESGSTFECRVDGAAFAHCSSPFTPAALADGQHTFDVRATDAAGNTDATPASQTFVIDTRNPITTIDGGPDGPTSDASPEFTFSASKPGATFECRLDGPGGATGTYQPCSSPHVLDALADGAYSLLVRAKDDAGNTGLPATRSFVVDTTAPPADVTGGPSGVTTDAAPAFSFDSADTTVRYVCRLDGPAGTGAEQACTSPTSFGTLTPGSYTFFVTAIDPAGNRTTTSRSFTVAAVQQQTPTPTPTPTFHKTVVVQPAGGKVLVRRKGTTTFVALDATQGIPLGSEVDAKHGKVRLSSVPKAGGKPQTALFYGGIFVVTQTGRITQLALSERLARCVSGRAATAAAKQRKPKTRNLWGDGHGSFRTKGRYSAATVRGTRWNVKDSCGGTLTRVARGVVAVKDFVKHRTKVLRAGQRYLAKPKRRR